MILSSIGAILASIGSIIAQSLTLLGQAIGGFLTQVGAFAGQIFQGIQYVGTTLFHGLASLFSLGAPQGVAAGTLKVSASEAIFHNVITIGVNYAVSKGLDALGVDPRISNLISSFVTGGIHGSFTATGMDFSNFFFDGLKNTLVAGSKDLLVHAGLDPKLAGVISLTAAPLFDGAWTGDINGSIQTIASNLPRDLTIYGIDRLGASIGLDPRINALLTTTVSSALNPTHTEAKTLGENIIRSVQDGLLRGVTNLGISYATQNMDPLLGALTSRAITGAIEGALSPNHDIFGGIYQGFRDSALNVARLGGTGTDSYSQAQYLQRVTDFSTIIQQRGLAQAIDTYAANIFTQDSISSILRTVNPITSQLFRSVGEWFQDKIDRHDYQQVQKNGQIEAQFCTSTGECVGTTSSLTDVTSVSGAGKEIAGHFGVDQIENWGFLTGRQTETLGDGSVAVYTISNGLADNIEVLDQSGARRFEVTAASNQQAINFNAQGQVDSGTIQSNYNGIFRLELNSGAINEYTFYQPMDPFDAILPTQLQSGEGFRLSRNNDGSYSVQQILSETARRLLAYGFGNVNPLTEQGLMQVLPLVTPGNYMLTILAQNQAAQLVQATQARYNYFKSALFGYTDNEAMLWAVHGTVGDLVGYTPLLEGIYGVDSQSGQQLSAFDRSLKIALGVLSTVGNAVGGAELLHEIGFVPRVGEALSGITSGLRAVNLELGQAGFLSISPTTEIAAANNPAFRLSGDIAETFGGNTLESVQSGVGAFETYTAGELRARLGLQGRLNLYRVYDGAASPLEGRFLTTGQWAHSTDTARQFLNLYDETGNLFNQATKVASVELDDSVRLFVGRAAGDNGLGGGLQIFVEQSYIDSRNVVFTFLDDLT